MERIHGMSRTPLYDNWRLMVRRCYNKTNKSYERYGARGIKVCFEWRNNFMMFYNWAISNGYKEGLVIDRINNNKNYEPSNCRYVTREVSARNRRKQKNNTSGFTGVGWSSDVKKWMAFLHINKKLLSLGYYHDKTKAVKARNKYIIDNELIGYNLQ